MVIRNLFCTKFFINRYVDCSVLKIDIAFDKFGKMFLKTMFASTLSESALKFNIARVSIDY